MVVNYERSCAEHSEVLILLNLAGWQNRCHILGVLGVALVTRMIMERTPWVAGYFVKSNVDSDFENSFNLLDAYVSLATFPV